MEGGSVSEADVAVHIDGVVAIPLSWRRYPRFAAETVRCAIVSFASTELPAGDPIRLEPSREVGAQ